MRFSRRNFIKTGGLAIAGVLGFTEFARGQKRRGDALSAYGADFFNNYLDTEFTLYSEAAETTAVLVAVKETVSRRRKSTAECFTLSFQIPTEAAQATYTVFHPQMRVFDLFLVPGASEEGEHLLNAVINRI